MEEILYSTSLPESELVRTDKDLYIVHADGNVERWNEDQDIFMSVTHNEIGLDLIRGLRFSTFPLFYPQP